MILSGWGRYPKTQTRACPVYSEEVLDECLCRGSQMIAHANGRSYGDCALHDHVLLVKGLNRMLAFDEQTGLLTCEAGVTLSDIITVFLPRGWFLSITPGTKHITVGGAVASDVHGKNHHVAGCFSACVQSLDIMIAAGTMITCSPDINKPLFRATCGGMGLTGVITRVTLKLMRVKSAQIRQKTIRAQNLEQMFRLFETHAHLPYSVAWLDCLASGRQLGRSLLITGDHVQDHSLVLPETRQVTIPFDLPGFCLNRTSVSLFNRLYYHRIPKGIREEIVSLDSFFYPLDRIDCWNRLYGKNGFIQYQVVFPEDRSFDGIREIISQTAASGRGSFLCVLKQFGPENENYLSFPMKGHTLSLDFKFTPDLLAFIETLNDIVLEFNGRLYLTKDSCMPPEMLVQGYTRLDQFRDIRSTYQLDQQFNSHQSKRLGI